MMRRKLLNCENDEWIVINQSRGTYPYNVYVDIKTGLYELLRMHFLDFMKMVGITPKNESDPSSCVHENRDKNGTERSEFDLKLNASPKPIEIKVKMYHTCSSLDVQGRSPDYNKVFEEFGNKTIAVHFVEDILERIKNEISKQMDLDNVNVMYKEKAEMGIADAINANTKSNLKSGTSRMGKQKFGLTAKPLKTKTANLSKLNLQKIVLEMNKTEERLARCQYNTLRCWGCM